MMRWIVFVPVLLVVWIEASVGWADVPLSQVIKFVDEEPEKAFPLLQKELARSDLPSSLRAQYLQLLALAHYNKVQKGRAKDAFRRALKIDPDVPLRGEMSPLMRQQFLLWRKDFLLHHAVRRRSPPPPRSSPNLVPPIVLLSLGVAAFAGALGFAVAAQAEENARIRAHQDRVPSNTLLAHQRNAEGWSLGANIAYATGGALLVTSAVLLILELTKPSSILHPTPKTPKERILW